MAIEYHYSLLSIIVFSIGFLGILLSRHSVISVLMSVELILLAANINFLSSSAFTLDLEGQILSIFVLSVAAAEVAIGLAILVVYFKNTGNVNLSKATLLKDL